MIFSLRFVATGAALLLAASLLVRADNDDTRTTQALAVAKEWVAEIDAGDYDKSYTDGGDVLHQKVPQDTWSRILKTERPLLGSVVTRTRIDQSYRPNGFEGSDGEFFLVSYRTEFTNKQDEIEHVVLRREGDRWRGVGYDFGPEQVETDPYEGPTTTTSTSTNTPPTPTNGITVPAKRPGN
jgi:hypothetical protein